MHSCLLYIFFLHCPICLSDNPWSFSQPITYMYDVYYVLLCINYIWNKWTVFKIVALELTTLFLLNSISKYFISIKIIQTQNNYSKDEWQFLPPISKQCIYFEHKMARINDEPSTGIPDWVLTCEYILYSKTWL